MAEFKIGEIHTIKEDVQVDGVFGEKYTIHKGDKRIIGADGLAHFFNGLLQPIGDNNTVKGYNIEGLTEWIMRFVMQALPDDMLEEYEVTKDDIKEQIEWALSEIL